jgi:hypothetical protein
MEIVFAFLIAHAFFIIRIGGDYNFDFTAENQAEAITSNGLFDTGETGVVPPFVEFTSKSIRFEFEKTKFASGDKTMSAGSVNMSDGRVDDSRFRRTTNL